MSAKFVLIGSGLAGGLLAAYLGRRGYEVDLYERRTDPREGNIVGGRSPTPLYNTFHDIWRFSRILMQHH